MDNVLTVIQETEILGDKKEVLDSFNTTALLQKTKELEVAQYAIY